MSGGATNGEFEAGGSKQVKDEEGQVDQEVKTRILESRTRVNEREDALFNGPLLEPELDISHEQAVISWGNTVRQFLRDIRPLLTNDDIRENEKYFENTEIGQMVLVPPDTGGYPFSKIATANRPDAQLIRALNLPPGVSLPRPHTITFEGLRSVLEHDTTVSHQWRVCVDATGPPPEQEWLYPTAEQPVGRRIYEQAVQVADEFLQQAGIGMETGLPVVDERSEPF